MGRMTCSSTLLIPHPWSFCTAPGYITWHSAVTPASQLTQELGAPHYPQIHDLLPSPWNTKETVAPVQTGPMATAAPWVTKGGRQQARYSQKQHHWTVLPEDCAENQAPELPLPTGLVLLCLQHYWTTFLEPKPGRQGPEPLLSKGLVPLCLQQLPLLQVAQHQQASLWAKAACRLGSPTPAAAMAPGTPHPGVDPRASAALWALDNSILSVLLPDRYLQLAT
jgi:hypothetical protein